MREPEVIARLEELQEQQERTQQKINELVQVVRGILNRIDDSPGSGLSARAQPMFASRSEMERALQRIESRD